MTGLDAVKAATWHLHQRAERSGIIADILAGQATRFGVALFLRSLLPAYRILDRSPFGHPALARSGAIEADLRVLAPGCDLPELVEATAYAGRVREATGDGERLVAHAYIRYLGDLNGGRIMRRRLEVSLGDVGQHLTFHDYPALSDKTQFARDYRLELDRAVRAGDLAAIVRETVVAFEMNILMAEAVTSCVAARQKLTSV